MDVVPVVLKILRVSNSVIGETRLPDCHLFHFPKPIRKPTLDELECPLQGDYGRGRQQDMDVVRHDNEFMQQIFPLVAIVEQHVQQQSRSRIIAKDWKPPPRNGRDEECTL